MRRLGFWLLAAILAGCTSYDQPASAPRGSVPPANATFATQLAGPGTYLAPMPTAVVILKPNDMARNRAFCAAFMTLPTVQEALAKSTVAPNLIFTRWLTQLSDVPPDRARDCEYLVGTYDYNRAAGLIAAFHATAGSTAGRGPFLAMVIPTPSGLRVAAVDGSRYAPEDFGRFIASWSEAINRTQSRLSAQPDRPGLVRSVFDLVSAVLRTVFGAGAGLIEGAIAGL
ncbi:MAG TPA: hypothetical protein VG328_03850 [Stellaceae bacterium]|jgi:hypothetical protein|nr:hypothetical protein [Stellaceae bacterium]